MRDGSLSVLWLLALAGLGIMGVVAYRRPHKRAVLLGSAVVALVIASGLVAFVL